MTRPDIDTGYKFKLGLQEGMYSRNMYVYFLNGWSEPNPIIRQINPSRAPSPNVKRVNPFDTSSINTTEQFTT